MTLATVRIVMRGRGGGSLGMLEVRPFPSFLFFWLHFGEGGKGTDEGDLQLL